MKWMILLYLACLGQVGTDDEYVSQVRRWQEQRQENLRKEDGWLTLAGLFWLHPGENRFGAAPDNELVFPQGPPHLGSLIYENSRLRLVSTTGVQIEGQDVHEREVDLKEKEGATVMRFGSLSWFLIWRDGRLGVRLKDSQSPVLRNFTGMQYFPIDPSWRVEGRFEPYHEPKQVRIPSVVAGVEEVARCPGDLVFQRAGQTYRLQAQAESGQSGFFVVFGDRTNGHQSYGGGRFLSVDAPDPQGRVVLDFNRAYSPPCVFTPYATCPLPPTRNRLPLEIPAGEKFAGH